MCDYLNLLFYRMEHILNRKKLFLVGLIILSIISFLSLKEMIRIMEIGKNITVSVTSLPTVNDVINQINNENNNDNSEQKKSNKQNNKKQSLKQEIEKSKNKLSKNEYKSAKSQYEQMTEHVKKLEEYKSNPYKFDNKGFLKNAADDKIRQQIINGRIQHLESEIKTFYDNIVKILSKVQ